jgi:hypothetical protein
VLKVTSTPIVTNDKCYQQALTYETICTKWGIDENDSCDADLGAPLICPYEEEKNDKCQWLLIGIKKKDHKCDENPRVKDSFAMFTDVAFHYDWITQNISPCSINYGTSTCKVELKIMLNFWIIFSRRSQFSIVNVGATPRNKGPIFNGSQHMRSRVRFSKKI